MKQSTKPMIKNYLLFFGMFAFAISVNAQNYLDTQYGQDGIEVHLLKANVTNKVLTVSFMFDNSTGAEVKMSSMPITNVNYTTADKKYPPLQDAEGKWLVSDVTYIKGNTSQTDSMFTTAEGSSNHRLDIDDGKKKVGWIKFEAPSDTDWPIEVALPGVTPFTIEKP